MSKLVSVCIAFVGASLLLVGCGRTTPMAVGPEHPASPDAVAAPAAEPSQTLAVSNPRPPTKEDSGGMGDHSGHDMGDMGADMGAADKGAYVCPMHPEVTSDDPDARCPKCGMKLVKKEEAQ